MMASNDPDHGHRWAAKRRPIVADRALTTAGGKMGARVLVECVIDRYHDRMQINDRQKEAGLRLRALWRGAVFSPSVTGGYNERVSGGGGGMSQADAARELRRVLRESGLAKTGPAEPLVVSRVTPGGYIIEVAEPITLPIRLRPTGHVVVSVCGLDEWAGGTRRLNALREGLTDLADFWGLEH